MVAADAGVAVALVAVLVVVRRRSHMVAATSGWWMLKRLFFFWKLTLVALLVLVSRPGGQSQELRPGQQCQAVGLPGVSSGASP